MGKEHGFTLIELLIVVAIIGIVAAIAIPNLMNAINRGRQKRTMADMRSIGTACEAYAVDNSFYPIGTTFGTLKGFLQPGYIKTLPSIDGWGIGFNYVSSSRFYTIISYGRDAASNGITSNATTTDFDCDIAFGGGMFIQWPLGVQTE